MQFKQSGQNKYNIFLPLIYVTSHLRMKLNNCRSQKFLPLTKQEFSPEDSLADDSPQICQLLQKLQTLQERQQKTKTMYLSKIQQLKNVLAQQNMTNVNLEDYLKELRKQNQKQLAYIDEMKKEILKELSQGQSAANGSNMDFKKSLEALGKTIDPSQNERDKSSCKGGLRLLKSMNLRDTQNKSSSKSNSRSKLSLFKASSTLFRKNSQTLLKKSSSTRDLIKIQSEYFEQNPKKY